MSAGSDNVMASNLGQKNAEQFMCLFGQPVVVWSIDI